MNIYHLKLIQKTLPLSYDHYSATVLSATSEEEARDLANKELFRGSERNFDLKIVKEHYMSYDDMKEQVAKQGKVLTYIQYDELISINWGFVENNEIWKNPEFTEIIKIGTSFSTKPEVHISSYHAG